jgi:PPOX class probable F420-dependent enzyme
VRFDERECWARLRGASHGVLGTVHAERGVDAVPVTYAVVEHTVVVPVDTVKAKRTTRLQRLTNVDADGRCVLLVDTYDDDWSRLWWVRLHGTATVSPPAPGALAALAARYPQYAPAGAVEATITIVPTELTGWAAGH